MLQPLLLLCATDDGEVGIRGYPINECIEQTKNHKTNQCCLSKQCNICHIEHPKKQANQRESKAQMNASRNQRQEENGKHLRIDTLADIALRHTHLLHDLKPTLIFIALGDLLIVDDQHGGEQEHNTQDQTQHEQA